MKEDLHILRDRSLLALFAARTVSLLGNAMAPVALAFAVLDLPGGTATTLGLVLTSRVTAQVVFVLIGGVIADRFPRIRVMVTVDIIAGVVQGVVALLVITGAANVGLLAILVVVSGGAAALYAPASRSVMPQLVSGEALQSANGLLQLSVRGGTIIGTALAGVLVAMIGPGPTLLVDAATFLLSAVLIAGVRIRHPLPPGKGGTVLRSLADGWTEFTARSWVWLMVVQLAFVNILLAGGFFVLGPVIAKQSLGGAPAWAAILTAQAIGFVCGSLLSARLRPRHPVRTAALLTMGFPLPLFLLASHASVIAIGATAFVLGLCIDMYGVLFDTTLQKRTPPESLSRLMSYESLGSMALVPIGSALIGPVSAAVGTEHTLWFVGALILVAGPAALLSPSIRRNSTDQPPDPLRGTVGTAPSTC
jgi:predicted MFS family arabinose efflux permease